MLRLVPTLCAFFLFAAPLQASATPFSQIIGFGDSLSDTGNLFAATGGTIPDPMYYDDGRFLNGSNYLEHLAASLGLSADPALFGGAGTNYAVGGARSRYHAADVDANGGVPPMGVSPPTLFSLLWQFDQFYTGLGGAPLDSDALYLVWGGSNDIQDVLILASIDPGVAQQRLNEAVSDVAAAVTRLVDAGAQSLLVPLVPDIGVTPAVIAAGPGAQAAARYFSNAFNNALDAQLASLAADIVRFDTFALLDDLTSNPAEYGIDNVIDPCLTGFYVSEPIGGPITECGAPDKYAFWDIVHPSARTHEVLGAAMRNAVPRCLGLYCSSASGWA